MPSPAVTSTGLFVTLTATLYGNALPGGFDLGRMNMAAQLLVGTHDFAAFGRPTNPRGSTVREVTQAEWQQDGNQWIFATSANAFLYHMVRRMVHASVMVGQGVQDTGFIGDHLESPNGPPIQGLAPPQGLALVEVCYPPE
jgi:tRNA pseudouridine38-40 synthase